MENSTLSAVNRLARTLSSEEFRAQHPHPVLIHEHTQSEIDYESTQTMGLTYMPTSIDPREARAWVVYPVRGPAQSPGTISLGRGEENTIVITDPSISKTHAVLELTSPENGELVVTDLGSTNGTFAGDERLPARVSKELESGTVVTFGRVPLRYLKPLELHNYLHELRENGKL